MVELVAMGAELLGCTGCGLGNGGGKRRLFFRRGGVGGASTFTSGDSAGGVGGASTFTSGDCAGGVGGASTFTSGDGAGNANLEPYSNASAQLKHLPHPPHGSTVNACLICATNTGGSGPRICGTYCCGILANLQRRTGETGGAGGTSGTGGTGGTGGTSGAGGTGGADTNRSGLVSESWYFGGIIWHPQ